MKAKSIQGKSLAELNEAIEQSKADGFRPSLAFVFSSAKQDINAICALLGKDGLVIFGATTSGEFIDGYQGEGSAALLLLDMKPEHFTLILKDIDQGNERDIARMIGEAGLKKYKRPAFIIAATGNVETDMLNSDEIIRGFEDAVGHDVFIAGGLAGNDMTFNGTIIFSDQGMSRKGLMALVLDEDKIELHGSAVSGWKALGTQKQITAKEGEWILSIDNEPALDVFLRYMGRASIEGDNAIDSFFQFSMAYPWQVKRENGSIALCTPVNFNTQNRSIRCGYPLAPGSRFRFSVPPDFYITDEVIHQSVEIKENNHAVAGALLKFSRLGWFLTLGP